MSAVIGNVQRDRIRYLQSLELLDRHKWIVARRQDQHAFTDS